MSKPGEYSKKKRIPASVTEIPSGMWLSVADAAEQLGVTKMTVRSRFFSGKYEGISYNGKLLVKIQLEEKDETVD